MPGDHDQQRAGELVGRPRRHRAARRRWKPAASSIRAISPLVCSTAGAAPLLRLPVGAEDVVGRDDAADGVVTVCSSIWTPPISCSSRSARQRGSDDSATGPSGSQDGHRVRIPWQAPSEAQRLGRRQVAEAAAPAHDRVVRTDSGRSGGLRPRTCAGTPRLAATRVRNRPLGGDVEAMDSEAALGEPDRDPPVHHDGTSRHALDSVGRGAAPPAGHLCQRYSVADGCHSRRRSRRTPRTSRQGSACRKNRARRRRWMHPPAARSRLALLTFPDIARTMAGRRLGPVRP